MSHKQSLDDEAESSAIKTATKKKQTSKSAVVAFLDKNIILSKPLLENNNNPELCQTVELSLRLRSQLTGGEEDDGLEAGVLGRVHLQGLQLLHLLLEDADVVHEGHHPLGRHGGRMQAGRRQQGRHVQRHGALGGVEDEELAPRHAQQRHLGRRQQAEVKQCLVTPFTIF